MTAAAVLLTGLLDDQPTLAGDLADVLLAHQAHRDGGYGSLLRSLLLPESALAAAARLAEEAPEGAGLAVTVLVEGGAGGLVALGRRRLPGLRLVGAVAPLRDLDDLAGNAARVVAAAEELDGVTVQVGLPLAPGWVRAVEAVEAAGLSAALTAAGPPADESRTAAALAEQLSVLIEADLPFSVRWPGGGTAPGLDAAALLVAVQALVDGAETADAARLLHERDPQRLQAAVTAWDEVTASRVRRRLLALAAPDLAGTVAGLRELGLLA